MNRIILIILLSILAASCKKLIRYHPDEINPSEEGLNPKNIQRINKLPVKDTFSFIVISDTQRFYDEFEDFIKHANSLQGVSLILIGGDISDFGLNIEFNLIAKQLRDLHLPYVAVIGNHDMLANGELIYNKMFGPQNFSFSYGLNKFIVFNSNSREVGFNGTLPDTAWLRTAAEDAAIYKNIFYLSHVPPFSVDFDKKLEMWYASFVSSVPNSRLSMHGHEHRFSYGVHYNDGFPYLIASTVDKRNYVKVTVSDRQISIQQEYF